MFHFGSRLSVQIALCISVLGLVQGLSLVGLDNASSGSDIARASFTGSGITATFKFSSNPSTSATRVDVSVTGLRSGFDNPYHIHSYGVGVNSNCTATGPHFNPTKALAGHCDPANPKLCEIGDLAGKHGNLLSRQSVFSTTYEDSSLQLSRTGGGIFYRSIVIHGPNKIKLACGTIIPTAASPAEKIVGDLL
ncbi:hypothetical protein PtA15_3A858 [Puccinia triticina]|uniref:Superoxide dismutase copper/zinc binding domain-containing protein n=1 Tax=Puccinia triticina TaxID=208348 RepID=A0ABY7CKZ5_9BASI|nr:uncharacterized protein PtA15_3A858 [Puccinia triticina]WAQ83487.1 hypothetical protein PtA15_3A858 [Puccinia triticina]WAR54326.1 hypothetical protein PtB15_3B840 [Puccinia triticina]